MTLLNTSNLIYTKPLCPYCSRAKGLLRQRGIPFTEIIAAGVEQLEREVSAKRGGFDGKLTWPQIFIGGTYVGGSDDLAVIDADGRLEALAKG